ncbi:hypothetical protein [Oleiagrimonas sp. MCCC 1A03011]|uniref:hypothetical protein n=1 Tax=Oleiagrimonas sp. MCCC 1A03011 TaxID=1926883 RepID=UPI000DC48046|nr:hypothetical protein [Oleiagrimonas sp. MCCC 1A03011]RAP57081.1 hypothetical protein BTJ49_10910 [Oleiagrimonas sp. MCCC 1A03011]
MMLGNSFRPLWVEYKRPWKLGSLLAGIGLLIAGSFYYRAPDWDVPISIIMAVVTYLTAPWSLRVVVERRWRYLPLAMFFTWFSVDGCYWLYWRARDPVALALMRDANFPASLSLYAMCGLIWYYNGSLKQLLADARTWLKEKK